MVRTRCAGARGPRVGAASSVRAGAAVALTLTALLLAGCAGSSGTVDARDAVLRPGDVPTGYKPVTHGAFGPQLSVADERALLECTELPRDFVDPDGGVPRADSPDFTYGRFASGPAQRIASSVGLFRSPEVLRGPLAHLDRDEAAACFTRTFRAGFARGLGGRPGVTTSDFAVRRLSLGGIGDQSAAFRAAATLHTRGGPVQQDLNLYFVRAGRALVTVYAGGFDAPFDQHLAEQLVSIMVARAR
jgi:hypothetical protein